MASPQDIMKEFEEMKDMAELKALSKVSLMQPLTDKDADRMIELGKKLGFPVNVPKRVG